MYFYLLIKIQRVKAEIQTNKSVTFEDFKSFYNVLFGGSDLQRAMFFLDTEKKGIDRYAIVYCFCRSQLNSNYTFPTHLP